MYMDTLISKRGDFGLNGYSAIDSVYNVPYVDPLYASGQSQYPAGEGQFVTVREKEPWYRRFLADPFGFIDETVDETIGGNNDGANDGSGTNDSNEAEEKPVDSNTEMLAIGTIVVIVVGYMIFSGVSK